ncbi:hypothetical protein [Breznakiella homolactica]|uniref:VWFA domain-containing protein n=1 Tax=Breznakiella homolactica TaxID=2798577 RepID=A0A7T7XPH3_9SPIR|nr:hypothetical protein [Breznakiella homolactica]QQO10126.1 hypothetical protein JFL75_04190 [Breznakiella homolactica]
MKFLTPFLVMIFCCSNLFSAGQAESGRSASYNAAETNQFAESSQIDTAAAINDYDFPYEINPQEDVSVFVQLEKNRTLKTENNLFNENLNLFIGLRVNEKNFFAKETVNYIIFLQSPELLRDDGLKNSLIDVLTELRRSQPAEGVLGIFTEEDTGIKEISSVSSVRNIISELKESKKQSTTSAIIDRIINYRSGVPNDFLTRIVWISNSDPFKDAGERQMINFFMELSSQNNISFSYLIYGETPDYGNLNDRRVLRRERKRYNDMPNWEAINSALVKYGGNSYFAQSPSELKEIITDDYNKFIYPAVRDIKISVILKPWISPRINNAEIKNMDYDEHRMFLHPITLKLQYPQTNRNNPEENDEIKEIFETGIIPIGMCIIQYYSLNEEKTVYKTFPLEIASTDDYGEYAAGMNTVIQDYAVLQKTGEILKQLSYFRNRNIQTDAYFNMALRVNQQIRDLEKIYNGQSNQIIESDVEVLEMNLNLLLEQIRKSEYMK